MLSVFSDMAEGILDLLGEDAFYAGATTPIKVNIEHGVQLTGLGGEEASYRGDLVANRDVATILLSDQPAAGRAFTQNGKQYRLEHKVEDNGVTARFVITEIK
ncbi:hypothetical protein [Comamonas antarctica]|uniref:hypothetical protein n=1 Tax=Comamonas antarctica TaxID=2743470 RepID=UPI0028EC983E|nr:hypothetical protein [Comamonas antarctica]